MDQEWISEFDWLKAIAIQVITHAHGWSNSGGDVFTQNLNIVYLSAIIIAQITLKAYDIPKRPAPRRFL